MTGQEASEHHPPSPTILIVDDSTAIRRILRRTLVETGYRVLEAADGRAALEMCRAEAPDLMLLDVDMPVMDGPTTLRELKDDPDLRTLPVLFLTARTGAADVAAGLELGAEDYLRKPCEPAELTARVRRTLLADAQHRTLVRQAREMNELSNTDALTGLGNRRSIEATRGTLRVAHGVDAPITVIMIDVDHFKAVNDTFGHAIGDIVLRIVARRLSSVVEHRLVLARWGGEEFLAVGVGLAEPVVYDLADSMRQAVSASAFAIGEGRTIPVTVSGGCATAELAAFDVALEAADSALYAAKRAGRNRVVVAPS